MAGIGPQSGVRDLMALDVERGRFCMVDGTIFEMWLGDLRA